MQIACVIEVPAIWLFCVGVCHETRELLGPKRGLALTFQSMNPTYESYAHWRAMMTETAGIELNATYCKERITALSNEKDPSTKAFLTAYGDSHRDRIVSWFEQALSEA